MTVTNINNFITYNDIKWWFS